MTKREAVIWLINIAADIGKAEHRDLWHYEQALSEIKEMLESEPERKKGKWIKKMRVTETEKYISYDPDWYCACCGAKYDPHIAKIVNFCYVCGADMRGEKDEAD